jgi:hypothetical protein
MVTARAFSPSTSKARAARVTLSTPPENAMTALSLAFIASFISSIFSLAIIDWFLANKIYVFASSIIRQLETADRGDLWFYLADIIFKFENLLKIAAS